MPSRKESAFYRRKNDERVEIRGVACKLYRSQDGPGKVIDKFDSVVIAPGPEPVAIVTKVIIEPYQTARNKIGDDHATEYTDFPFTATLRFADDAKRLDLIEIAYEYARAAGLTRFASGEPRDVTHVFYTRFKLVNRVTSGINSDLMNKFFISPTEETWNV
jgi:hypothetical protein